MGYWLQLRILLWKNLTLKKRTPFVLMFELFIPLVLFIILIALRHDQPPRAVKADFFRARPLPSAGVMSIMQAFCDGGEVDKLGYVNYPDATASTFLAQFSDIAHHNNFFDSSFTPQDMDHLPALYRSIIDDPAALHHMFLTLQDIQLGELFTNWTALQTRLTQNVSIPSEDLRALHNSTIDFPELYRALFGVSLMDHAENENHLRTKRDTSNPENDNPVPTEESNNIPIVMPDTSKTDPRDRTDKQLLQRTGDTSLKSAKSLHPTETIQPNLKKHIKDLPNEVFQQSDALKDGIDSGKLKDIKEMMLDKSGLPANLPPGLQKGLFYQTLVDHPEYLADPRVRDVIEKVLGFKSGVSGVQPEEVVYVLKKFLLTPSTLRHLVCDDNNTEFQHVIKPADIKDIPKMLDLSSRLCQMDDRQWKQLSGILNNYTSSKDIDAKFHLDTVDVRLARQRVKRFITNLQEFLLFEKNLNELSKFASSLPQDACPGNDNTTGNSSALLGNVTNTSAVTSGPEQTNAATPVTEDFTTRSDVELKKTTDVTTDALVTVMDENGKPKKVGDKAAKSQKKKQKYGGLLKLWLAMQQTICGKPPINPEQFSDDTDLEEIVGLTKKQKMDIGILVHVLYSNPKVLYSPNNSDVDKIIAKANESFALVDRISEYANKWLNVSAEIRTYLEKNSTEQHLEEIREMQFELKRFPIFLDLMSNSQDLGAFVRNGSVPEREFFFSQLDNIDNAACSWLNLLKGISLNVFRGFRDEKELLDYVLHEAYHDNVTVFAGVVFTNINKDGSLPPHIVYKIRQNATFTHDTRHVRPWYWFPGPMNWGYNYYQFGFAWVQDVIERAIVDITSGRDVVEPGSYIHQFPYPCYLSDRFLFMIEHVMPLCLTISWVYTVAMLVRNIVYEKEQRLKEVMKMMGLYNSVHWLAWFITTFLQMSVSMGMLTLMLHYGHVLTYSNPWLIFLTLEIFTVATIAFSFLVSVLYSKAKLAAACAGIVYFLSYVPYMYVAIREEAAGDKIPAWAKSIASLFSTTAFGLGSKYFAFYEIVGVGVQWSNIYISPVENDEYNLFLVLVMMVFDGMLYGLLTWYIENVHPGSYGLPKPWCFPFTRSYWCGHTKADSKCCPGVFCCHGNRAHVSVTEEDQACAMARGEGHGDTLETEPSHLNLGVCIDNLTKVYKSGKLAVNHLSLNLYEGQITSFLGHNGAGKTTTMSILTGLFPPTSGYATIYGHDIRTEMEELRKGLGMCPQHNVLFDKLTVDEHLWFYARLKGMPACDIKGEMERMIQDVAMLEKRNSLVDCLSGGMKRKLSVAIAFVAGSHTVILDEPTAGVDPYARRQIWDLLIKYKEGRTILLSTHHMDEADILGDRIAIISNGQLKCCGSSLFLKNMFGDGYHLTLVKAARDTDSGSIDTLSQDGIPPGGAVVCTEAAVTEFIVRHVTTAYLSSETTQELHYILPFEEAKKGGFEKLFASLDTSLAQLGVSSYGVADTTLEEVFLKVTEKATNGSSDAEDSSDNSKLLDSSPSNNSADDSQGLGDNQSETSSHSSLLLDLGLGSEVELGNMATSRQRSRSCEERSSSQSDVSLLGEGQHQETEDRQQGQGHDRSQSHRSYVKFVNQEDSASINSETGSRSLPVMEGKGTYIVQGHVLLLQQFIAILLKRAVYIRRNWKGLFSQILLPALFVCVAMTVALSAPQANNPPPLVLSPAMYFNYTQPRGNFIPYSNMADEPEGLDWSLDAGPSQIIQTFRMASGVAATCVLKTPFNSSFDEAILKQLNFTYRNFKLLDGYFEQSCESVFQKGLPLENFVPPAPTDSPLTASVKDKNKTQVLTPVTMSPVRHKYFPDCHCTEDSRNFICEKSGFENPPSFQVVTSDILQDISGEKDEQTHYLHTSEMYRLHRYGAFSFGNTREYVPKDFGKDSTGLFHKLAVRRVAKVWYNHKGFHSIPTYLNTLNNAILRANLPRHKGNPAAYGITLINHPMDNTDPLNTYDYIMQGSDVLIAIFIIVAMSFVPASFVLFLVYERSVKAKHLQFVCGINRVIYWLANYVWDVLNYVIPALCCIIILKAFDIPAYVSQTNYPAVVSLFLMYGWSITPMMYPASFVFDEPSTAYICLIVINLFIGITCIITSYLLEIFQLNDKNLAVVHENLKMVFLVFPNYCLGRGLMDIAFNEYENEYYFKTGQYNKMRSPFEWTIVLRNLVAMATIGLIFFLITLMCEFTFFRRRRKQVSPVTSPVTEDVDVANERRRVLRGSGRRDVLRLENLVKIYKTRTQGRHLAVDRLCLGVPHGECFGMLGVNGAGKTTTFRILTGDLSPTGGEAFLNGHSVLSDSSKVQQSIGYCPQFDALYDELTAREHLLLYSRLRGIPFHQQHQVVEWALKKLALTEYADKPSVIYSGGNKRKLSTAIALIGQPPVIFLDEPTTGMDPHSRRFLWDLILDLINSGHSIILTSHSMEECEVLCTRLAIMVNGRFTCMGSIQHLKNRFGDGYTASIRVCGPSYETEIRSVVRFMTRNFPQAKQKEVHHNMVQYELPSEGLSLSRLFAKMEEAQQDLHVEDYSVSQNNLDNVFINFVSQQVEIQHEPQVTSSPQGQGQGQGENERTELLQISLEDTTLELTDDEDDLPRRLDQAGTRLSFLTIGSSNC